MTKETEDARRFLAGQLLDLDKNNKQAEDRLLTVVQEKNELHRKELMTNAEQLINTGRVNFITEFNTAKSDFQNKLNGVLTTVRSDAEKWSKEAEAVYKNINVKIDAFAKSQSNANASITPETFEFHAADLTRLLNKGIDNLKLELIKRIAKAKSNDEWEQTQRPIFVQLTKTLQHEWLQFLFARLAQSDQLDKIAKINFGTINTEFDRVDEKRIKETNTYKKHHSSWIPFKDKWNENLLLTAFVEIFDDVVGKPLEKWGQDKLSELKKAML